MTMGHYSMNELRLKHLSWFLRSAGIELRNKAVLDIGCGGGELGHLATAQGVASYCGLDISQSALERARALNPTLRFAEHDARQPLPSDLQRLDVIALFDVIEHVTAPDELHQVLEHVMSRLAPGGIVIGRTCNADSPFVALHRYNDETHKFAFRTPLLAAIFARYGMRVHYVDEDSRAISFKQRLLLPLKLTLVFVLKRLVRLLTGEHIESLHPSIYFVVSRG